MQRPQNAYTVGHLSHEELDERLQEVLTARTRGETVSALVSRAPRPRLRPTADGSSVVTLYWRCSACLRGLPGRGREKQRGCAFPSSGFYGSGPLAHEVVRPNTQDRSRILISQQAQQVPQAVRASTACPCGSSPGMSSSYTYLADSAAKNEHVWNHHD